MALRTPTHDLIDLSCVVGITALSKHQDGVGNYFVLLDVELAPKPIVPSGATTNADAAVIPTSSAASATEKMQLELTLPQFYHLLAEMEECKSALASLD